MKLRLNRFLSMCGLASRRKADTMIEAGKVKLNGQVVREMGLKVESEDVVEVDGVNSRSRKKLVYYAVYKPVGYVSSMNDPQNRPCVVELVPKAPRVYPVGRLDLDSEGLIILTNDGDYAYTLTHPKHEINKTYRVLVKGEMTYHSLEKLTKGVRLTDEQTSPAEVEVEITEDGNTWIRLTIHEGKNRQVRRMLKAVGYDTLRLIRVKEDEIDLGNLKPGEYRLFRPAKT